MHCCCRSSTLSLFIRSVAQIDLSATSAAAGKLQKPSFKPSSTTRQFRTQYPSPRFYSASTTGSNDLPASISAEIRYNDSSAPRAATDKSAIVEISMDAIDALLAEAETATPSACDDHPEPEPRGKFRAIELDKREPEEEEDMYKEDDGYASPLKTLLKTTPQKKARPADAPRVASRSIFREPDSKFYTNGPSAVAKASKEEWVPPSKEPWMIAKEALKKKFPDGYQPLKRLSPDAIAGIKALHAQMPEKYTTRVLSQEFEVSPESIRRILKSKWQPDAEEESDRARRWFSRGEKVWSRYAELGVKPPKKWRDRGIGNGKPEWMKKRNEKFTYEVPPLPALITTATKPTKQRSGDSADDFGSLADKIL